MGTDQNTPLESTKNTLNDIHQQLDGVIEAALSLKSIESYEPRSEKYLEHIENTEIFAEQIKSLDEAALGFKAFRAAMARAIESADLWIGGTTTILAGAAYIIKGGSEIREAFTSSHLSTGLVGTAKLVAGAGLVALGALTYMALTAGWAFITLGSGIACGIAAIDFFVTKFHTMRKTQRELNDIEENLKKVDDAHQTIREQQTKLENLEAQGLTEGTEIQALREKFETAVNKLDSITEEHQMALIHKKAELEVHKEKLQTKATGLRNNLIFAATAFAITASVLIISAAVFVAPTLLAALVTASIIYKIVRYKQEKNKAKALQATQAPVPLNPPVDSPASTPRAPTERPSSIIRELAELDAETTALLAQSDSSDDNSPSEQTSTESLRSSSGSTETASSEETPRRLRSDTVPITHDEIVSAEKRGLFSHPALTDNEETSALEQSRPTN